MPGAGERHSFESRGIHLNSSLSADAHFTTSIVPPMDARRTVGDP
jgi:hypothetical protein